MNVATIIFPIKDDHIYLAIKKQNVGAGFYNGYGGKLEEVDQGSVENAAIREFTEEGQVTALQSSLEKMAIIDFFIEEAHIFECHIYFCKEWKGNLTETEEMGKPEAFDLHDLPYDKMMIADKIWMPFICDGQKIRGRCYYTKGNKDVRKFEYEALEEGTPRSS